MAKKRKRNNGTPNNQGGPKRQHHTDDVDDDDGVSAFKAARGYFDHSTGQRGAFPGLDEAGDDFFCGPANDGMDYLRMVRSEARGVPSLLIAKAPLPPAIIPYGNDDAGLNYDDDEADIEDGECYAGTEADYAGAEEEPAEEDTRGWYEDGTYVGAGIASFPERPPSPHKRALLAWHDSFMANFRAMRALLHDSETRPQAAKFSQQASNAVANDLPLPHRQEDWLDLLSKTSPTPTFLWRMDQHMILKGFKINMDLLKVGADTPIEQTRWIYGMLLRCSNAMTPDETYIVRDLGKRAIHVQKKLEKSNCLSGEKAFAADANKAQNATEVTGSDGRGERAEVGILGNQTEAIPAKGAEVTVDVSLKPDPQSGNLSTEVDSTKADIKVDGTGTNLDSKIESQDGGAPQIQVEGNGLASTVNVEVSQEAPQPPPPPPPKRRKNRALKDGNYDYTPSANTLGTLDMIISIVGDFFGQRDLLEERVFHTLGGSWEAN